MPLIAVYSPKGGTGKTTLAANLCHSLSTMGLKTVAVDFDPQNALRLQFGIPLADTSGYVASASESAMWSKHLLSTPHHVFVLPYGKTTIQQRSAFEMSLIREPSFVARGLQELLAQPDLIVVADLPTANIYALQSLLPKADVVVTPLLADTASLSLLPEVENLFADIAMQENASDTFVVINQADYRRKVSKDVEGYMVQRLNDTIIGIVHRDESVVEANAAQQSISSVNHASVAAFDIEVISKKLAEKLGLVTNDGSMFSAPAPHHI